MNYALNILLALLIILTLDIQAESLSEQLNARAEESAKKTPEEVKKAFAEGIESVKKQKVTENAKDVGDKAPDFTLKNAVGNKITLSNELKKGPVILTWYRGGWCPYCNITMHAMQEKLPAFKKAGASLIALTPELPDKTLTTKEKNGLEFEVLTDLNQKVAQKYGLLFKLIPEVEKLYGKFFSLKEYNGEDAETDTLPLAATYIIGKDGLIKWAFLHHDYRKRAEPSEIAEFLNQMQKHHN